MFVECGLPRWVRPICPAALARLAACEMSAGRCVTGIGKTGQDVLDQNWSESRSGISGFRRVRPADAAFRAGPIGWADERYHAAV